MYFFTRAARVVGAFCANIMKTVTPVAPKMGVAEKKSSTPTSKTITAFSPFHSTPRPKKAKPKRAVRMVKDTSCLPAIVVSHYSDGRPKTAERATRSGYSCRAHVKEILGDIIVLKDKHGVVFRRMLAQISVV